MDSKVRTSYHIDSNVELLLQRFCFNGHIIGFHSQTQKLELFTTDVVLCESSAEAVSFEWSYL